MKLLALLLSVVVGTITYSSDVLNVAIARASVSTKNIFIAITNDGEVEAEVIIAKACWVQSDGSLDDCQQLWLKGKFYPGTTTDAGPVILDAVYDKDLNVRLLRIAKVKGDQ
jgi:hypothetical protein